MQAKWIVFGAFLVTCAAIIYRIEKSHCKEAIHFFQDSEEPKNFGAFPPDIPESEFERVDFV